MGAIERCPECGAPVVAGVCGSCAPTGAPLDKGERRLVKEEAAHEKERWDRHLVTRKTHARSYSGRTTTSRSRRRT